MPGSEERLPHWCAKSSAVPRAVREEDERYEPQRLKISFRPKKNERLTARNGEERRGKEMENIEKQWKKRCCSTFLDRNQWENEGFVLLFVARGSTNVASGCKWRAASRRISSVAAVAATMRRTITSIFTRPRRFTSKSHLKRLLC